MRIGPDHRWRLAGLESRADAVPLVQAAGGLVLRDASGLTEVAIVHRPHRGDWTFPKGKVETGESAEACALREVEEETGLRSRIDGFLAETRYLDNRSRDKVVSYFVMTALEGAFEPNDEVDELVFLAVSDAPGLLTYARDRELCELLLARAPAKP